MNIVAAAADLVWSPILRKFPMLKIALSDPADSVPPFAPMLRPDGVHISTDAFSLVLTDPFYLQALLLSLKVAQTMGLTPPRTLVALADEVIE